MDKDTINEIAKAIGCNISESVVKVIIKCDLSDYESLCELRDLKFVMECTKYCENLSISPGDIIKLKNFGVKLANIEKTKFLEFVDIPEEASPFPLLEKLRQQITLAHYDDVVRDFSLLLRIKCGRQAYELLARNLPLMSISATDKYLHQYEKIVEGELQV